MKRTGDIPYRFTDGDRIRDVLVNEPLRAQLAAGTLAIVRHGQGYELLPRAAADKVYERDAAMVVLDHGRGGNGGSDGDGADDALDVRGLVAAGRDDAQALGFRRVQEHAVVAIF